VLQFAKWKQLAVIIPCFLGMLLVVPNFLSEDVLNDWSRWFPQSQLKFGLDLRGGSSLLLAMQTADVRKDWLDALRDDVSKRLREAKIAYSGLSLAGNAVQVRLATRKDTEAAMSQLRRLVQLSGNLVLHFSGGHVTNGEGGLISIAPSDAGLHQRVASALSAALETVRRRVDALGTTEPTIVRQGSSRILVQVPGLQNITQLKELIGKTARLSLHEVYPETAADARRAVPPGYRIYPIQGREDGALVLRDVPVVRGNELKSARPTFDPRTNAPVVAFTLNSAGAQKFANFTENNVGRPFAILLDDEVISAPVIREPILGGSGEISGNFTVESANQLAILLTSGTLPAKLSIVEERTVGPSLGADSIKDGKRAGFVAAIVIVIFTVLAYGTFGIFAVIGLIVHTLLTIALMGLMGSVLTLPGIAGLVLGIAMAVDANVLIFERIREELRAGVTPIAAIEAGFKRAFVTIADSQLTTLVCALALFWIGDGPIRGFAVTLTIGICTSIFASVTVVRLLIFYWLKYFRRTHRTFEVPLGYDFFTHELRLPFMRYKGQCFVLSLAGMALSLALFAVQGLDYGVDFKGGSLIEAYSNEGPADIPTLREELGSLGVDGVQIQQFGSPKDVLIRVEQQPGGDTAQQVALKKVAQALAGQFTERRVEFVGPAVSSELRMTGFLAVAAGLVAIVVYVWFRFQWQFALGAIVALLHDVLLTIGIFSLLQLDFDLSIVAALLTILGYSVNDTVVVSDRIRENLRKFKHLELNELLNRSINETLSRTILTGCTALVVLSALYLFGGHAIRNFNFAMLFGVLVGTYSSVFIAAPLLGYLGVKRDWAGIPLRAARANVPGDR
jgi:SecD/SecF fusion protein